MNRSTPIRNPHSAQAVYNDPNIMTSFIGTPSMTAPYPTAISDLDLRVSASRANHGTLERSHTIHPRPTYHDNVVPWPINATPNAQGKPYSAAMKTWLSDPNETYRIGRGERRS